MCGRERKMSEGGREGREGEEEREWSRCRKEGTNG